MPAVKGFAIRHPVVQQIMIHRTQPLWRLLQAQLMVCFFLYFLFVKVYQQLLYSLTQIAKLVFYWLSLQITGLFILLHFGLKIPRTLHRILTKKLQREVLSLTAEILWHFQTAVRYIYFWLTDALQYWLASWISELFLLFCSSVEHQFHHFTYSFCQEKLEIYKAMLQPAIKQIVVSLFLGFLAGVQEAFCIVIQVLKYVLIQFFRSIRPTCHSASKAAILDDITSTLPRSCTPLCTRFKGPPINTFEDIPQTFVDLKFVVATEHTISGPGRYGLDGTNIPLHVRFQSFTRIRNASSIKKKDVPLTWLKVVCVFYVALYLSMFSGAVNNIK